MFHIPNKICDRWKFVTGAIVSARLLFLVSVVRDLATTAAVARSRAVWRAQV